MTRGPRARLRRWLEASVANRLAATLFALTLGFLAFSGAVNFAYLFKRAIDDAEAGLVEYTADMAVALARELDDIADHCRILARNPTVVSAVLDVKDQETYVTPLLRSAQRRDRTPRSICVTDFKGQPVSCLDGARVSYAGEDWLGPVLKTAQPRAAIRRTAEDVVLVVAHPVIYEGTGAAEGLVVSEFDLVGLTMRAMGDSTRFPYLRLSDAAGELFAIGSSDTSVRVEQAIGLHDPFANLALRVDTGVAGSIFTPRISRLAAVYAAAALLLAFCVVWAVRRVVPPLTTGLRRLADEADRVAGGAAWSLPADDRAADEIGQLTRSFGVMVTRLARANASLERQVADRTRDLNRQRELLATVLDASPGMVFQLRRDPRGRIAVLFASHAVGELFGIDPVTARSNARALLRRVHRGDRARVLAAIAAAGRALAPLQVECRVVDGACAVRWVSCGTSPPVRQADGGAVWHGFAMDITSRKLAELSLAESEAYNKALFANSFVPCVVMDPQTGAFVDCNDAAVRIYRLGSRANVLGRSPADVSAPSQYDGSASEVAAAARIQAARTQGAHVFEWRHQRPDGELWDAEVRLTRFFLAGQELLHLALRDITEQKRSDAESWRRANFDALTGLANRGLLRDRLERSLAQARRNERRVGVMYLDLDGFKSVNDSFGHAAGDELLVQTARRFEDTVREQDTAARIGGDEFVLVVQDAQSRDDLGRIAGNVIAALGRPFELAAGRMAISASVGIAVFPDDAQTVDQLLERADTALYRAKRQGKNLYRFHAP